MAVIDGNGKVGSAKVWATTKQMLLDKENKRLREGFQDAIYRLDFAHGMIVKKSVKEIAFNNYKDSKKVLAKIKRDVQKK